MYGLMKGSILCLSIIVVLSVLHVPGLNRSFWALIACIWSCSSSSTSSASSAGSATNSSSSLTSCGSGRDLRRVCLWIQECKFFLVLFKWIDHVHGWDIDIVWSMSCGNTCRCECFTHCCRSLPSLYSQFQEWESCCCQIQFDVVTMDFKFLADFIGY